MAKQTGPLKVTGKLYGVSFYKMDSKHYARTTSSLSGKRVKKDPAFAETMRYAGLLGQASKIASVIYRQLPKTEKDIKLYRTITGEAMRLLKEGIDADAVSDKLRLKYL